MAENEKKADTTDEALLKRIRQRYRYALDKWDKNRREGQTNMKYVSGDPWTEADKKAREGRPTVCADELNQYVNQVVNTARQNPRGIKVDPAGDDATEELAEYRENRIRAIEYACNASRVYINALQAAVERNMGYWKVSRAYVSDESDEQEIVILPVMNPDNIVIDPDYKELDASDIRYAFELDKLPVDEFEQEYPDAEKRSFSPSDFGDDQVYWYDGKSIVVASYWEVKTEKKTVGKSQRTASTRTITQVVTNGIEILKKGATQPGPYIPIVPVFGKELWIDNGGGAERVLLSLVSLARDAQKALAYVMSSMLENVGQLPKTGYVGAKGQFESDELAWKTSNNQFHPFLQYDMITDAAGNPVPPPTRTPQVPDFQAYSIGTDICRRAIMAAMGVNPLPTQAARQNQKSGVALEKIQSEQAIGSYHLVDSYDQAIKLTGRIINHWLSETDLGQTSKPVRLADGQHKVVEINTDEDVVEGDHTYHFPIADDQGRYQVTISSGPSHESQREEGSEFVDSMLTNLKNLPLAAPQAQKILALGIKLKQLGPLGDQMAEIISPDDQNMQQQQQMAQLQQQGQLQQQELAKLQGIVQKLMLERQGRVIDNQFKMAEADKDRETKIAVAEIETKAQIESERQQTYNDLQQQFHDQAHETAMQAAEQQHEQAMGQQQASQQQQLAAQQGQQQSAQSAQDAAQSAAQVSVTPAQGE